MPDLSWHLDQHNLHRIETALPDQKLEELLSEPQLWSLCKKCSKRELLSLIGKLNFACHIIFDGHIFRCHLINLSTIARLPHLHISINVEACWDIAWWLKFLCTWNGCAIIPDPYWSRSSDLDLFTGASSTLGYGVYYVGH